MIDKAPRGFMLLEMIAALILLTAFALVASQLFTWSMRVVREAPPAEEQLLSFDSMVEALRADAWSAERVQVEDERTVRVGEVRWAVTDDGAVVRTARDESRVWPGVGTRVRFVADDAGVVVRVLDRGGAEAGRILVVSELQLLRRAPV